MKKESRPLPGEYNPYFEGYISLVPEIEVMPALSAQVEQLRSGLGDLREEQAAYRYAEGKWSIRQMAGHLIDTERVFGYRALSIARGESANLPSFDEKAYAQAADHDGCRLFDLVAELCELRRSHVLMFRHLPHAAWDRVGLVGGHATSARALAFIMVGHVRHHAKVLAERYGVRLES